MRVVCVFCFVNRSKLTLQGKFCLKVLSVPVQVFLQPVDLLSAFLDVEHFVHQVVHVADTGHHWLPAGGLGHVWRIGWLGGLHNWVEWGEFLDLLFVLLYIYIYNYYYCYPDYYGFFIFILFSIILRLKHQHFEGVILFFDQIWPNQIQARLLFFPTNWCLIESR